MFKLHRLYATAPDEESNKAWNDLIPGMTSTQKQAMKS